MHGHFLINLAGTFAHDLESMGDTVHDCVKQTSGVDLRGRLYGGERRVNLDAEIT